MLPSVVRTVTDSLVVGSTSEAVVIALLDLCNRPDVVQILRAEVEEITGAEGWSKTAIYKLKRMDSFLKESQRVHASTIGKLIFGLPLRSSGDISI